MSRYELLVQAFPILREWKRASEETIVDIKRRYPGIPDDYLSFLLEVGTGKSDFPSFRLYSKPSPAIDVYGAENAGIADVVLFGDDYQGFTSGFDKSWRVVQLDSAEGSLDIVFETFDEFIRNLFS